MGAKSLKEDDGLLRAVIDAKQGSAEALSDIIELTQDSLYRFTYYLSGNQQLAHDICQDTYIKVLEKIKNLKEPERFKSWLFQMAKNLYLDHVKSARNKGHVSIDNASHGLTDSADKQKDLEIRQALSHLETDERLPLLLVDLEGHSYVEAATIIGISEDALRSRLQRARQAFAEKYKKS